MKNHARLVLLLGLLASSCVVQTEPGLKGDPGPTGDAGPPGKAGVPDKDALAALQASVQELQAQTKVLQSKIDALEAATFCPRLVDTEGHLRAYTVDNGIAGVVRCVFGADEMVKVGSFWVDRYESVLVAEAVYSSMGTCDGVGTSYGTTPPADPVDDYPAGFSAKGNWANKVYACSAAGHLPSRRMTWFQAQQACTLVGKDLCSNAQWQAAVAGTVDPGNSDGVDGACVTAAPEARATGAGVNCRSAYGAEDMIGNVSEWVADWFGSPSTEPAKALASFDTWGPDYGSDAIFDLIGFAGDGEFSGYFRRPAAATRGGSHNNVPLTPESAGAFAISLYNAPSNANIDLGTRCCAGVP